MDSYDSQNLGPLFMRHMWKNVFLQAMNAHFFSCPIDDGLCVPVYRRIVSMLVLVCLFFAPAPLWGEERDEPSALVLVLPRGDDSFVEDTLFGALEGAGLRVLSVDSEILEASDPRAEWKELEERARGLELEMRFREAAEVWRDYRDGLLSSRQSVSRPNLLADAQLALAASWVESGELELARLEFRRALGIDRRYEVASVYNPRVRAFFDEAGQKGPGLAPVPRDEVLDGLIEEADVDAFLWVSIGCDDAGWVLLQRLRFSGQPEPSTEVRRRLSDEPRSVEAELRSEADRMAFEVLSVVSPLEPASEAKRWRWPLIGTAGVVAALTVGLISAGALTPPMIDVVVRH